MRTLSLPPAEVWICPDAAAVARTAAAEITRVAEEAGQRQHRCALALAGGSTPRATYTELAASARQGVWETAQIFFSDERLVPLDHPDSNYRMAHEAWLGQLPMASAHPVATQLEPHAAAVQYEETIRRTLDAATQIPRFDLILLGLGADGHTASLFPGTEALGATEGLVAANWVPQQKAHRITFTYPLLNHARQVMFLVTGAGKAEVVREVLTQGSASSHPAAAVRPAPGRLLWLTDEAAAARLT